MSLSRYFLVVAAVSIIVCGVFLLSAASDMSWREAMIVVSAPVILTVALIWSVCEIKRLNR